MAIKNKCGRCGRFVGGSDTCCGEIKQVKIEKRKPDPEDDFDSSKKPEARSLAEALFGPGGELVEEEVPKKGKKDGKGLRKGNEGGKGKGKVEREVDGEEGLLEEEEEG